MTIEDFYNGIKGLAPYKRRNDFKAPYYDRLKSALNEYQSLLSAFISDDGLRAEIREICSKLTEIVRDCLSGLMTTGAVKLNNLIKGKKGLAPKIDISKTMMEVDACCDFYRIRVMPSVYEVSPSELFHIPLNMRGIVKTQRYSTPGYPCLYLGASIYGCWEEMRRPIMHNCAVSRLENSVTLTFIDMTLPEIGQIDNQDYLKLFPLIVGCMIPVNDDNATFKPEYTLSQLLIEWVLKNRKSKSSDTIIHGVAYTSTHLNSEFQFPETKFINFAIPVLLTDSKNRFCKELCNIFRITPPTTNEIEKLKCGYDIELFEFDDPDPDKIRAHNFDASDFGNLEQRLKDTVVFPLYSIDSKTGESM